MVKKVLAQKKGTLVPWPLALRLAEDDDTFNRMLSNNRTMPGGAAEYNLSSLLSRW